MSRHRARPKPEPNRTRDTQTLVRLTAAEKQALVTLADHLGMTQSDLVAYLVREKLRQLGLPL